MCPTPKIPLYQWLAVAAVIVLLVDILTLPYVLAQPIDLQTGYYAVATLAAALILAALVELRMSGLDKKLDALLDAQRKTPPSETPTVAEKSSQPEPELDRETERMKIGIAASYITTSFSNLWTVLLTIFVAVLVSLLPPLLTRQISFLEFFAPVLGVEIGVLLLIADQREKLDGRIDYLDELIRRIDTGPTVVGTLQQILSEARRKRKRIDRL